MSKPNMLIAMSRLTDAKEDFLTEALAGALRSDPVFADAFFRILLRERYTSPVKHVLTQYEDGRDRPDMLIRFEDGTGILIENKIDAGETEQTGAEDVLTALRVFDAILETPPIP